MENVDGYAEMRIRACHVPAAMLDHTDYSGTTAKLGNWTLKLSLRQTNIRSISTNDRS